MTDAPDPASAIKSVLARHLAVLKLSPTLLSNHTRPPLTPDVMTPDHPFAKALGLERATALFDTPARRRAIQAKQRRDDVRRLSLAGKPVREIAAELGLSYGYVVELRMALGVGRRR
ncbi:hypothetical protein BH11PSE6_BH11PSE6_03750 [soil metagenome]